MMMYIRKPDLDTVFTAFLLDWRERDEVRLVHGQAPAGALANPDIFCIECGGAGQIALGNFDHHNTPLSLPPACLQALHWQEPADPLLWEWAEYVAAVDVGRPLPVRPDGWTLSKLFSGLRLNIPAPLAQFRAGIKLCRQVTVLGCRPGEPLPLRPEWEPYRQAKERLCLKLERYACRTVFFRTHQGRLGGFLETSLPGVHGLLRRLGCQVSIAQGISQTGTPVVTIASQEVDLRPFLAHLNHLELGWGGPSHGQIIASPPAGSNLLKDQLLALIMRKF